MEPDAIHPHPAAPPAGNDAAPAWLGRRDVLAIPGALKASAYVARAYLLQKNHGGHPPAWARKLPGGQWQFTRAYVETDARQNLATVGITEAATILGASRRAIQTWVDEGIIPTTVDKRHTGESRHIDRTEFMRLLPTLKTRLISGRILRGRAAPRANSDRHIPALPAPAPGAPLPEIVLRGALEQQAAEEAARIESEARQQLADTQATRARIAHERATAERQLRQLAREERKAAEREARLKAGFAVRIERAHQDTREADRRRAAAAKTAERTAAQEQKALDKERKLRDSLTTRLADWRKKSTALISAQLQEAREAWQNSTPASAANKPNTDERRRSADAVATQLRAAREEKLRQTALQSEIDRIAARLAEEVAEGRRDRYDAAILFNEIMDKRAVPGEIRIDAMKKYFGR